MNEIIDKKHTLVGVASCIIGILNLSYAGILTYDSDILLGHAFALFPDGSFLAGFIIFPLFYLGIPIIGNGIGLILGLVGLFLPDHKRLFAVLGLIINAIVVIFLIS